MTTRRLVTVDSRARISLGTDTAPPGATYRVVLRDGVIILIPVTVTDDVPVSEALRTVAMIRG
jgi:hypothetical protein